MILMPKQCKCLTNNTFHLALDNLFQQRILPLLVRLVEPPMAHKYTPLAYLQHKLHLQHNYSITTSSLIQTNIYMSIYLLVLAENA